MSHTDHALFNLTNEPSQFIDQVIHRYYFSKPEGNTQNFLKETGTKSFINLLATAFESPEKFSAKDYSSVSLPIILEYLKRTHSYYQSYYFSKIDLSIDKLYKVYPEAEDLLDLLSVFFDDYRKDIFNHIAEEEEKLFPYIYEMLCVPSNQFKKKKNYSIAGFVKQHTDENENTLVQVINMIRQQYPDAGFSPLNILVRQIEQFEKDLRIHHKVEEEVLIPKAQRLEALVWPK